MARIAGEGLLWEVVVVGAQVRSVGRVAVEEEVAVEVEELGQRSGIRPPELQAARIQRRSIDHRWEEGGFRQTSQGLILQE